MWDSNPTSCVTALRPEDCFPGPEKEPCYQEPWIVKRTSRQHREGRPPQNNVCEHAARPHLVTPPTGRDVENPKRQGDRAEHKTHLDLAQSQILHHQRGGERDTDAVQVS